MLLGNSPVVLKFFSSNAFGRNSDKVKMHPMCLNQRIWSATLAFRYWPNVQLVKRSIINIFVVRRVLLSLWHWTNCQKLADHTVWSLMFWASRRRTLSGLPWRPNTNCTKIPCYHINWETVIHQTVLTEFILIIMQIPMHTYNPWLDASI